MNRFHTFHIPVMGIGFTLDSPLKVAKYGINSVMSLVDDALMEPLREYYAKQIGQKFQKIDDKDPDCRANRITAYLNTVADVVVKQFEELKSKSFETGSELNKYFEMLPDTSKLKKEYLRLKEINDSKLKAELEAKLKEQMRPGSIDVNIMTKLDTIRYKAGQPLPQEFQDAHAAMRGYANSKLSSTLVLSAGMSPKLYSYTENFGDFFPQPDGTIKKKIALKVSDYRSAIIQGKIFAKKGIWVSEYRIESGLNCGGHAFASDGFLLGPIMEEFRQNREELKTETFGILKDGLAAKGRSIDANELDLIITVQGGIGTHKEDSFLLDYYKMDGTGWGSPFLLVPEASSVDAETMELLASSKRDDFYLSGLSPIGVPFNTVKNHSKELEKQRKIAEGKPGSPCPKRFLVTNTEYTDIPICLSSSKYQGIKLKELEEKGLEGEAYKKEFEKITEPSCLCVGLGTAVQMANGLPTAPYTETVIICPGPNTAYFNKISTLQETADHIYGRANLITDPKRPHMFTAEVGMYIDYLENKRKEAGSELDKKQLKYFTAFKQNMADGFNYYNTIDNEIPWENQDSKTEFYAQLQAYKNKLDAITI
jgi:hypothetical protein